MISDSVLRRSNLVKTWVEVIAIIAGAAWAFVHFRVTEAPAQERNLVTTQRIDWERADSSSCFAVVSASFENLSRGNVKIRKARWRVWLLPEAPLEDEIAFLDPDRWAASNATASSTYYSGPFVQAFPPQAKAEYDLTWRVKHRSGFALFRIDLFPDSTDSEPSDWLYAWDTVCNGVALPPKG